MNPEKTDYFLNLYNNILDKYNIEVRKLQVKQEEYNKREQDILTIKENTNQILKLLQEQQRKEEKKVGIANIEIKKQEEPIIETKIQSLKKATEIEHKSDVWSITELSDLRIATGDDKGYITLFTIDYEKERWTKLNEELGHDNGVNSLCELSRNKLVSSGSFDYSIKVWDISNDTFRLIKTLDEHSDNVCQVIPFTKDIIASGSQDQTIKIWNVNAEQEDIKTLKEDFPVCSILKLRNKDEMVAGGRGETVSFWNTITFEKVRTVECCDCENLIELHNHYVAVSGASSPAIDIIDPENYRAIKRIEYRGYIGSGGLLHLLNNGTFIYSNEGCFCQISSTTYEVLLPIKMEKEFLGFSIASSSNGEYIIADNWNKGISIFKVSYI